MQFSIVLMAIVIFEVGVGAGAYAKKDELNEILDKGLDKTLKGANKHSEFKATWNLLQSEVCKTSLLIANRSLILF